MQSILSKPFPHCLCLSLPLNISLLNSFAHGHNFSKLSHLRLGKNFLQMVASFFLDSMRWAAIPMKTMQILGWSIHVWYEKRLPLNDAAHMARERDAKMWYESCNTCAYLGREYICKCVEVMCLCQGQLVRAADFRRCTSSSAPTPKQFTTILVLSL